MSIQDALEEESENAGNNVYIDGHDKSLGIITTGLAFNYLMENFPNREVPHPILKITQYPLPQKMMQKIVSECKEILVIEEGMPVVEEMLKGILNHDIKIKGRLDGSLPRSGEVNPNLVAVALGKPMIKGDDVPSLIVGRPPSLCEGCPHTDSYLALNEAMTEYGKGRVFSDIGCYTLAALPPLEAINSCVDMGASITMARGAAEAGLLPQWQLLEILPYTFRNDRLIDAVIANSPITVIILDNSTTGMTGGQPSAATGRLKQICLGLGVEENHIRHPETTAKTTCRKCKSY